MTASMPNRLFNTPIDTQDDITALIPDFPFDYAVFLDTAKINRKPLFNIPSANYGQEVCIVGGGMAGLTAAYELMRSGLKPIIFEADRIGGRMDAKPMSNSGTLAEMGSMRFPLSGKALFHYINKVGAYTAPFPNPGTAASFGNLVNYRGENFYYERDSKNFPIPSHFVALEQDWQDMLDGSPTNFQQMRQALIRKDITTIKRIWNNLITGTESIDSFDNISFYNYLKMYGNWSMDEIDLFGQVGFGTGGWNTDFPNCILEVLRVAMTYLDSDHQLIYEGSTFVPSSLLQQTPSVLGDVMVHWSENTTVQSLTESVLNSVSGNKVNAFQPSNSDTNKIKVEYSGPNGEKKSRDFSAVIYTPQVRCLQQMGHNYAEQNSYSILTQDIIEAVQYTHYMQSAKTFIELKTPFWKERDSTTGKYKMSITLTDRKTRGTYLLDYTRDDETPRPVVCISYTWNDDALKYLPLKSADRLYGGITTLYDIDPNLMGHLGHEVTGDPITISWENELFYLGAFKNNLPGQYRMQRRLFTQFMQNTSSVKDRFILAGDDISWTAGWAEGAVSTAINAANAVAGLFEGSTYQNNSDPVSRFNDLKPVELNAV